MDTTIDKNEKGEATNITLDYKMTVPRHVQSKLGLDLDGSNDQVKFQVLLIVIALIVAVSSDSTRHY